jgi:hypothetical protein
MGWLLLIAGLLLIWVPRNSSTRPIGAAITAGDRFASGDPSRAPTERRAMWVAATHRDTDPAVEAVRIAMWVAVVIGFAAAFAWAFRIPGHT